MRLLVRLGRWLFAPGLYRLERHASEYGRITLQHVDLPDGLGWHCSIRAHQGKGPNRGPRYAWTATADTIAEAIAGAIAEAADSPIKKIEGARFAPKLGGPEFDE